MAKHKRRRSEPTREPPPAEKEGRRQSESPDGGGEPARPGQPPPPPARPSASAPPSERPGPKKGGRHEHDESIEPEHKARLDRLFWIRVGVAVAAGTAATFIFEPVAGEERRWASIAFMIAVFVGTVFVGRAMGIRLPRSDRKKLVTQGIGSYIFLYLFMWIVSYTLVNIEEAGLVASPIP